MIWTEEGETPDILKSPSRPRAGVMVQSSTSFSTALDGGSKALTVSTVLEKGETRESNVFILNKNIKLNMLNIGAIGKKNIKFCAHICLHPS